MIVDRGARRHPLVSQRPQLVSPGQSRATTRFIYCLFFKQYDKQLTAQSQPHVKHLPGQYVDLSIPSISTVGGFTITSPPQTCLPWSTREPTCTYFPTANAPKSSEYTEEAPYPYIELAIQKADDNPPAAYLWHPESEILGSRMDFKIGGNFTFPPMTLSKEECEKIDNVVFIAGGVGVNPIISMLGAMDWKGTDMMEGKAAWGQSSGVGGMRQRVRVLYSSKREKEGRILFEDRLEGITSRWENVEGVDMALTVFETGDGGRDEEHKGVVKRRKGRIQHEDLFDALGPQDQRKNTVVYVCGVPGMTDEFVDLLKDAPGMDERRVLCEKWW